MTLFSLICISVQYVKIHDPDPLRRNYIERTLEVFAPAPVSHSFPAVSELFPELLEAWQHGAGGGCPAAPLAEETTGLVYAADESDLC